MLYLLSNITINSLADAVSKATGEEVYISSGYNTWAQELFSANFEGIRPDVIFVILDGERLFGDYFPLLWNEAKDILDDVLSLLLGFVVSHKDILLFVSSLDLQKKKENIAIHIHAYRAQSHVILAGGA